MWGRARKYESIAGGTGLVQAGPSHPFAAPVGLVAGAVRRIVLPSHTAAVEPTNLPQDPGPENSGSQDPPVWIDELHLRPGPPWRTMGLRTLALDDWLVVDDCYEAELAQKQVLLAERGAEVLMVRPAAEEASIEVLGLIEEWLARHHPTLATGADPERHPLDAAGRLVQEDLCLMVESEGHYRLEGASLCFPSHWRLEDKLGLSLAAIHTPVPHYAAELERKVDTFFDRLRADRPVWRRNWSIHSHDTLFSPEPFESPESFAPTAAGVDGVWLRSERQTLVRLPRTAAVLFTIKTQLCPIAALTARPERAQEMAEYLRAEGADLAARGDRVPFPLWLPDWLDRV